MKKSGVNWSLYLITDRRIAGNRHMVDIVRDAIQGGVTVVQFREKTATTHEMIDLAHELHQVTLSVGVPLIVNDRVDVALAVDAEGVHVGPPDDMPAATARRLLGEHRIIGVSADSPEIARQAVRDGADYVGVGDIYGTTSKGDAGNPIGLSGLKAIVEACSVPVVGIGGINHRNAAAVIESGASGVAVISAILSADDPAAASGALRKRIDDARKK